MTVDTNADGPRFQLRRSHSRGLFPIVAVRSTLHAAIPKLPPWDKTVTIENGEAMLARWHTAIAALGALAAENSKVLALASADKQLRWLRCPPAGFDYHTSGFKEQTCRMPQWCPYCWGRRAGQSWKVFDRLLFPLDPEDGKPAKQTAYDVIRFCSTIRLAGNLVDKAAGVDGLGGAVAFDVRAGKKRTALVPLESRKVEMRRADCVAAVEVMSCDIDLKTAEWLVRLNQLFVVYPHDRGDLPGGGRVWEGERLHSPRRRDFADALIQVFRYPDNLLRATPAQQSAYLWVMKKRRAIEHYGLVRKPRRTKAATAKSPDPYDSPPFE